MLCKRCPHLVKHGQVAKDGKISFKTLCGLKMKQKVEEDCQHFPFPDVFDYLECSVYSVTFKSAARKNDVVPTRDIHFSEALSGNSITEMEYL